VSRRRAIAAAGLVLFACATVVLFFVSRGRWSDAIIDSGREWIVPDALARGDLLYRDVVYWFGPFTPYFHALFFRLFGSSFQSLALAGCFGAAGVLASLYFALRQVTDRTQACLWMALAVPVLVFMPYAGGAILGMGFRMWHAAGFGLLAVGLAVRSPQAGSSWMALGSGIAAGFAGLCRTEWGIAALAAACLTAGLRAPRTSAIVSTLFRLLGGFGIAFGGGLGLFVARAGARAVILDAPVLLFNLPAQTREHIAAISVSSWGRGAAQAVYSGSIYVGAFLLIEALALSPGEPTNRRRRLAWFGALLLVFVTAWVVGGFPSGAVFSGAPLLCAASVVAGMRRRRETQGAALAGFGTLGLLASYRRPFFITDGPYVAAPLLFAIVCAAACVTLVREAYPSPGRGRLSSFLAVGLSLVIAIAFAGRLVQYGSDERVAIPGTGGMLSAPRAEADQIRELSDLIRQEAGPGGGVVVFPEGEVLNYLTGRPNPIRDKLYLPGYVTPGNEARIVEELSQASPSALVIWPRPLGEYGSGFFGQDYALSLERWIEARYRPRPVAGWGAHGPRLLLPMDRLACSGLSNRKW
jgi:hypothetical protein